MATKNGNLHKLTDQQIVFCREYAKSLNATEAFKKANYVWKTEGQARANAARLIANDNVRAYLSEIYSLNEVSVINAVCAIAFTEITEVIRWTGSKLETLPSDQWSDRAKLAVKKFKYKRKPVIVERAEGSEIAYETEIEVEMYDRLSALDKLMRKLKLYPRELQTIECVSHLAAKGLLLPEQAEAILNGISEFEERLRSLSGNQTVEVKRGISEELAAEIRSRIMGIDAESIAAVSSEVSK